MIKPRLLLTLLIFAGCQQAPPKSSSRSPQSLTEVCTPSAKRLEVGGQILLQNFPQTSNFTSSGKFIRFNENRDDICQYEVELEGMATIPAQAQLRLTIESMEHRHGGGRLLLHLSSPSGRPYQISCWVPSPSPDISVDWLTERIREGRNLPLAFPEQVCGNIQVVPASGTVPPAAPGTTGAEI